MSFAWGRVMKMSISELQSLLAEPAYLALPGILGQQLAAGEPWPKQITYVAHKGQKQSLWETLQAGAVLLDTYGSTVHDIVIEFDLETVGHLEITNTHFNINDGPLQEDPNNWMSTDDYTVNYKRYIHPDTLAQFHQIDQCQAYHGAQDIIKRTAQTFAHSAFGYVINRIFTLKTPYQARAEAAQIAPETEAWVRSRRLAMVARHHEKQDNTERPAL